MVGASQCHFLSSLRTIGKKNDVASRDRLQEGKCHCGYEEQWDWPGGKMSIVNWAMIRQWRKNESRGGQGTCWDTASVKSRKSNLGPLIPDHVVWLSPGFRLEAIACVQVHMCVCFHYINYLFLKSKFGFLAGETSALQFPIYLLAHFSYWSPNPHTYVTYL